MISNFALFGPIHLISIIIPILIGIIFIVIAKKYPNKLELISAILVITIILIRSIRYAFDINLGVFSLLDLLSLHICHIDLILLIVALLFKHEKLFVFTFLIGIPTALGVALLPGKIHPEPGEIRAILFIMSHMMLVMGSIYILVIYRFKITFKDIKFYYIFTFIAIIVAYIVNYINNTNFMYLLRAPSKTVLETLYNIFGPFMYLVVIYLLLNLLITIIYFIYKVISKFIN